jgi:cell division protease FtsH
VEGRRQILSIHSQEVRLDEDADLERIAQITPGFSGADLANIVNEAALLAVRRESEAVAMADLELAIERVVAGLQRKMPLSDTVRRKVAYHEGGHALVAQLLPNTDPIHKVSIIPTAKGALGYTMQMPEEDQYLLGQSALEDRLAVLLGGRSAELLIVGEASTGAANDLERATELARRMVTEFGMAEALGPVRYAPQAGAGYLGRMAGVRPELSPETASAVDHETRRLVEAAQAQALGLLRENEGLLHAVAETLLEQETISGDEIARIVEGT